MTTWKRASVSAAAIGSLALLLSACSSMSSQQARLGQPEQLQPVQDGAVASTDLPTIGQAGVPQTAQLGVPPTPGQINPSLTGQPVLGGNQIGEPVQTASRRWLVRDARFGRRRAQCARAAISPAG